MHICAERRAMDAIKKLELVIKEWDARSKKQEKTNKKHLSFYIPMPLYKMLKESATRQNKTMTRYFIIALVEKIKRES